MFVISLFVRRYELGTEFWEALEHAMDKGKNTKVLLRVSEVGETLDEGH